MVCIVRGNNCAMVRYPTIRSGTLPQLRTLTVILTAGAGELLNNSMTLIALRLRLFLS